jgi:hypothetical protein
MRTHPCVRLFCIVDTLTSASVLPGIDDIIKDARGRVVRAGHGPFGNMSRYRLGRQYNCAANSSMKTLKTYSNRVDAEVARIALIAAGVPSVVVGIGTDLEGGAAGVQLLVADENVEAARKVLDRS